MINSETVSPDLWQSKPWWCQPWTIILTGVIIVAGSWFLLHTWWITTPICLLIGVWWLYFLVIVPRMLRQMAAESGLQSGSKTS
jgi:hypothetical protein